MPQGTFVPSHCSSFSPQTKGIILYLNTFHTTIGCFLQTYFHSKVNNRFIVCAPHRFKLLSCAKTVCSDSFFFSFFFFVHWERFNLETFTVLGYIWSCERRRRIKKKKQRRLRKKGSQDIWSVWRVFRAPWREKRERAGRGHKIQLLGCAVLTLFMCLSFEIWRDLCAVAFSKNWIKYWKFLLTDFVTPSVASVRGQMMRPDLLHYCDVKTVFPC